MKFKVYRNVDSKRLRKVVVELQDAEGKVVDRTFMFGYLAMIGLRLRIALRKRAMLRLHKILSEASKTQ